MIGATIRKDVWLLLRDRGRLLIAVRVPVMFIVVFGSMFKFGARHRGEPRPIAIWHAAGDARGETIEQGARGDARVRAAPTSRRADAVRAAVAHERSAPGSIVPRRRHRRARDRSRRAGAGPRADRRARSTGVVMRAHRRRSVDRAAAGRRAKTPPGIAKPLDEISGFQVTVPGNAVLFGFFIAMTVAMSFASERHTGTWRRLLAAPVPRWKALLGKLVPYYLIGCVQLGAAVRDRRRRVRHEGRGQRRSRSSCCPLAVVLCATSARPACSRRSAGTEKQIGSIVPVDRCS